MAEVQVNGSLDSHISELSGKSSENVSFKLATSSNSHDSGINLSEEKSDIEQTSLVNEEMTSVVMKIDTEIDIVTSADSVSDLYEDSSKAVVEIDPTSDDLETQLTEVETTAESISVIDKIQNPTSLSNSIESNDHIVLNGETKNFISEDLDKITLTGSYVKISLDEELQNQNILENTNNGNFLAAVEPTNEVVNESILTSVETEIGAEVLDLIETNGAIPNISESCVILNESLEKNDKTEDIISTSPEEHDSNYVEPDLDKISVLDALSDESDPSAFNDGHASGNSFSSPLEVQETNYSIDNVCEDIVSETDLTSAVSTNEPTDTLENICENTVSKSDLTSTSSVTIKEDLKEPLCESVSAKSESKDILENVCENIIVSETDLTSAVSSDAFEEDLREPLDNSVSAESESESKDSLENICENTVSETDLTSTVSSGAIEEDLKEPLCDGGLAKSESEDIIENICENTVSEADLTSAVSTDAFKEDLKEPLCDSGLKSESKDVLENVVSETDMMTPAVSTDFKEVLREPLADSGATEPLKESSLKESKMDDFENIAIDDPVNITNKESVPLMPEAKNSSPLNIPEVNKTLIGSSDIKDTSGSQVNSSTLLSDSKSSDAEAGKSSPTDEWLDILGNGLLKKKILVVGKGEKTRPTSGSYVSIRFEGKLEDATIVEKVENLRFILGDEDVIQAFDLAVALMEENEKAIVTTDARYAYGIHGRPDLKPPIPQNALLTYEIEVLSVGEGPNLEKLSPEERVKLGDGKRLHGNELYAREEFSGAINLYKRGIKYLEGSDDKDVFCMKIKCLNNLSAAQLKVKAYKMAIQSLDTVLQYEPENVKALFRKGKCLDGMKKEEEALEYLKKASTLDPNNKSITAELTKLKTRVASTQKKEKEIYQKMFNQRKEDKISKEEENLTWTVKFTATIVGVLGMIAAGLWYKNK